MTKGAVHVDSYTLSKAISTISNQLFYRIYAKVYTYFTFDIAPNILYTISFIVNCNERLSAEFVGQTSVEPTIQENR